MAQEADDLLSHVEGMLEEDVRDPEIRQRLLEIRELMQYVKLTGRFPRSLRDDRST